MHILALLLLAAVLPASPARLQPQAPRPPAAGAAAGPQLDEQLLQPLGASTSSFASLSRSEPARDGGAAGAALPAADDVDDDADAAAAERGTADDVVRHRMVQPHPHTGER